VVTSVSGRAAVEGKTMLDMKILIDTPAKQPTPRFKEAAAALAGIIRVSNPRFAVGIFGSWGSGKTTLMEAVQSKLQAEHKILTVNFNAWRFEREPVLLIPLLDEIRAAVVDRVGRDRSQGQKLVSAAKRIGTVVGALAAGFSGSVGIPGAVTISYDVGSATDAVKKLSDEDEGIGPRSLYLAAFTQLRRAVKDLKDAGVDRVVVFVDDLDRCLPANALDVLEAIKLLVDLDGFVFVVGLDEPAIDRAVQAKYLATSSAGETAGATPVNGREYAKKIFQVPYSVPVIPLENLGELLNSIYTEAGIDDEQLEHLHDVADYLKRITVDGRVNPREVRRFINAYTLQTIITKDLTKKVILALQTLAFRPDWRQFYDFAARDPGSFSSNLRHLRNLGENKFPMELPKDLDEFLQSSLAYELAEAPNLALYVSSLHATTDTDPTLDELAARLDLLRERTERDTKYYPISHFNADQDKMLAWAAQYDSTIREVSDIVHMIAERFPGAGSWEKRYIELFSDMSKVLGQYAQDNEKAKTENALEFLQLMVREVSHGLRVLRSGGTVGLGGVL
jgi:KAP family P-loop domain